MLIQIHQSVIFHLESKLQKTLKEKAATSLFFFANLIIILDKNKLRQRSLLEILEIKKGRAEMPFP
jgi:hypothetical protein